MANLAWHSEGDLHVIMHNESTPTDAEWDQSMSAIRLSAKSKVLVYSMGGGPTARQRHTLSSRLWGTSVAVVTTNALIRAMALALRVFNPRTRVYAPAEESQAFEYLELTATQRDHARITRKDLARRLAIDLRVSRFPSANANVR